MIFMVISVYHVTITNIIQGTCSTSFGIWQLCLGSQGVVLQQEIKKVQNRAARFVTSNYCFETGSMTEALQGVLGNRGIRPFISGEQKSKTEGNRGNSGRKAILGNREHRKSRF